MWGKIERESVMGVRCEERKKECEREGEKERESERESVMGEVEEPAMPKKNKNPTLRMWGNKRGRGRVSRLHTHFALPDLILACFLFQGYACRSGNWEQTLYWEIPITAGL